MTIPYLILHKVRGEAQFDIAEQDCLGDWVVSSSGHGAYPMFAWKLEDIVPVDVKKTFFHCVNLPVWHNLRDHYYASDLLAPRAKHYTVDDL